MKYFKKHPALLTGISSFIMFLFIWGSAHLINDRNTVVSTQLKQETMQASLQSVKKTSARNIDTNSFVRFEQTFVNSATKNETIIGVGSAVVIKTTSAGSYILTNEHVCDVSAKTLALLALQGKIGSIKSVVRALDGETSQIQVLKKDKDDDMCVVFAKNFWRPEIGISNIKPRIGDEVYVMGSPKGYYSYEYSMVPILKGIFNGYDQNWHSEKDTVAVYSIRIAPGNSGSAVLDKRGNLIGVVHSHLTSFDEITFGTTYKDTKDFIDIYLSIK